MGALEVLRTLHDHGVETRAAGGARRLDQRGGVAVRARHDGLRRLGGRPRPRLGVGAHRTSPACAFGDELARIGYRGPAPCARRPFHAYYELHVEQGPRLEREGATIGVPRGIVCLHWYDVYVEGTANQVGPTPMEGRADALVAAAEMVLAVQGRARAGWAAASSPRSARSTCSPTRAT